MWSRCGASASSRRAWRAWRSAPAAAARRFSPPGVVVEVKAIAGELPATLEVPLSRLFVPDIRDEVISRGIVASISESTIWRWLAEDAIRPWTFRSWMFPRDPDFEAKAARVLDLYAGEFEGSPLAKDEYVISADEKTSIQARCRCHPSLPAGVSRAMRVEHEYRRGGALQYLATWDCHRAKIFGLCAPKTGIVPFDRLVHQVMTIEPYASARRVFLDVDNGSSHRAQTSMDRLEGRYTLSGSKIRSPGHAAIHWYSWMSPPRMARLLTREPATPSAGEAGSGGRSSSARCGLSRL